MTYDVLGIGNKEALYHVVMAVSNLCMPEHRPQTVDET